METLNLVQAGLCRYDQGQLTRLNLLVKAYVEGDIFGELCRMLSGLAHSISHRPACTFVMCC